MSVTPEQTLDPAGVLRVVAHDLRQPLSTIESISYYVRLVVPHDDFRALEQLAQIERLIQQCDWILSSALQLTQSEPAGLESFDLEEMLTKTLAARSAAGEDLPTLKLAGALPALQINPLQMSGLLEIALTLFQQISGGPGAFAVATQPARGGVRLSFSTTKAGYGAENALGNGSGLALSALRRIVESNRGSLDLKIDPVSGVTMHLVLP